MTTHPGVGQTGGGPRSSMEEQRPSKPTGAGSSPAGGAHRTRDYQDLSRDALEARLKVAEDVCVLYGWTGGPDDTERGKALLQLWMIWHQMSGVDCNPDANRELDGMVPGLAAQRDRTRVETLALLDRLVG